MRDPEDLAYGKDDGGDRKGDRLRKIRQAGAALGLGPAPGKKPAEWAGFLARAASGICRKFGAIGEMFL